MTDRFLSKTCVPVGYDYIRVGVLPVEMIAGKCHRFGCFVNYVI
jgi:hypothetical protein